MKVVCASSLTFGGDAFATLGEALIRPERSVSADVVRDADALVTRSKVRINRGLLDGSRVRFVGTATAGTDHMDLDYLASRNIAWSAAPGCNANSVAEYVMAALLVLARRHRMALRGMRMAVVGVGHVGRLVADRSQALGLVALKNDPPLFEQTADPVYRPLDEILPQADIVTLHVPLTETGPHATRRLAADRFFERMKPGAVFINAARGEVTDSGALLRAVRKGIVRRAVLDVFEHEPVCPAELAECADVLTPHIAGYSFEGKVNGTHLVYRAACRHFNVAESWSPPAAAGLPPIRVEAGGRADQEVLAEVVRRAYDIEADDAVFRDGLVADAATRGKHFEQLRAAYPVRHEFHQRTVEIAGGSPDLTARVAMLGFAVRPPPRPGSVQ
jgi:erythronate-4-phosphate dehydrogenase